jgi:hypothetical protein
VSVPPNMILVTETGTHYLPRKNLPAFIVAAKKAK